jgi:hypothetical protein
MIAKKRGGASNKPLQAPPGHCFACPGTLARNSSLGAPERDR